MELAPGDPVRVPLGGRAVSGVVWDDRPGGFPAKRLKPVAAKLDAPPLPDGLRRFIDWVAQYTMAERGAVLALAFKPALLERPAASYGWAPAIAPSPARITPARASVLEKLPELPAASTAELAAAAGVSPGVVRSMANAGLIQPVLRMGGAPPLDPERAGPTLSREQAAAAAELRQAVREGGFGVTLLDGVTGSGKTEVYLEAAAEAVRAGKQVLALLPEIALSAQFIDRFAARFGAPPLVWHSEVSPPARRATWHAVAEGRAGFVVGARSALFLPFTRLGLIVVDEEHETAFKQEEGVTYHARDMAVVRARIAACPIVLSSATPSLESVMNVEAGRYRRLELTERHGGAGMPRVVALDLRETPAPRGRFLSPPLVEAVRSAMERGEQAMLFLNRRGYAPLTLCRTCGHRIACPNCTAWLVEHRARHQKEGGTLLCHHCGHEEPIPMACPVCGATESLAPVGPGVERIEEEAAALFPEARRLVMASDAITGPQAAADAAHAISEGGVDLIIGTQMIAKGWHFPALTLVGVVDADLGLSGADLRAAERSVQLLHQVAGRAGRAER
ncbi:MAG TPA: primosomal protein N', partial [Acetobacteraceae bacterium]|nr:primosomal protein N' [Acetobacteraceae bacterium]